MKTTQSNLQREVRDELQWEPSLDASRIGVAVENGVVVLSGHVRNLWERGIAEQAVKRLRGVRSVANELQVDLLADATHDDVALAKAGEHALAWHVMVPDKNLKLTVSKGWVTIEGEVPFAYQRRAAQHALEQLVGVRGVTNKISVRPAVAPDDLRRRLNTALHRYACNEFANIETRTEGSRVVLSGKVRSWIERDLVQDAAWSAPGVTEVDNYILVES